MMMMMCSERDGIVGTKKVRNHRQERQANEVESNSRKEVDEISEKKPSKRKETWTFHSPDQWLDHERGDETLDLTQRETWLFKKTLYLLSFSFHGTTKNSSTSTFAPFRAIDWGLFFSIVGIKGKKKEEM